MADLDDLKPGDEAPSASGRRGAGLGVVRALGDAPARAPARRHDRVRRRSVSPYFLQSTNLFFICLNVGEIAIMALPLTLIVITGEIDLSVASILGLCGRRHGRALQARLADLAGDDRGRRCSAWSSARSTASSSRASACRRWR